MPGIFYYFFFRVLAFILTAKTLDFLHEFSYNENVVTVPFGTVLMLAECLAVHYFFFAFSKYFCFAFFPYSPEIGEYLFFPNFY